MKFGVREICDVVLKAKAPMKIGKKVFYKNEPVIYFDSLKTSSMEGAATTVYAQGGRGNSRLVAWEGERTVTFTMEDALISAEGFMILSGAGLIEASAEKPIYQHIAESTDEVFVVDADFSTKYPEIAGQYEDLVEGDVVVLVKQNPYLPTDMHDNFAYIMITNNGEPVSEPFIPVHKDDIVSIEKGLEVLYPMVVKKDAIEAYWLETDTCKTWGGEGGDHKYTAKDIAMFMSGAIVLVDYYTKKSTGARQIEITPDKFGGNYYLEASTLFRDTNGVDMPAEFIIPNCKIQSNFTFTMASTGDPSTFTFTMDAFPDYTRFDKTKKVLAAIQIIDVGGSMGLHRHETEHEDAHDKWFA
jgi:hypothetical protein